MKKECLNHPCSYTFTSNIKGYEKCPECGSATIPIDTKNNINSIPSGINNNKKYELKYL